MDIAVPAKQGPQPILPMPPDSPEARARENIDRLLTQSGWQVQDRKAMNLAAGRGVAVREFPLKPGHGTADYLLYVDRRAVGVVEAKKEGTTLTGVETQTAKYSEGLPDNLPAPLRPLPFLYQSTGVETRFTNGLDPEPRSREVFSFHRPETFAEVLGNGAVRPRLAAEPRAGYGPGADTLRGRLRSLPPLDETGLWPAQVRAVRNLERSLAEDRPRALIQMATGSGKTFTAITSIYRLIKHAGARRVLFLVDRGNLGRQAKKEFDDYPVPGDGRKFTNLYNVQHVTSNQLDDVARVHICTIQRLYSMLRGEELPEEFDERSLGELERVFTKPVDVAYNPRLPIEYYDVVFVDECHRSIYTLWRQVLEYFDAYLVGLTATPSKQTFGFFHRNLVMEYGHEQAVADRVNVDFDVYRIRTQITEGGSKVEAGLFVDRRDRLTRRRRWERLDEELVYGASALDRDVVAEDQIRTVIRTFRERLFTEIFPGREHVPKTLIFAKDDSHADDIVKAVRLEFGKGNEFVKKITYRSTGAKPEELISEFRTAFHPRIAVTVDMIATGTDIKPVEIVMFMRAVKSRNLFEQMKGRGVRVIQAADLQSVTPDAPAKTRFVIVDAVGICEQELVETRSLDRRPTVKLDALLDQVAMGSTDPDVVSTLAGRLARLDVQLGREERAQLARLAGTSLQVIVSGMVQALDPDRQAERACADHGLPPEAEPSEEQVASAAESMLAEAVEPVVSNPDLRAEILRLKQAKEQTIDAVSQDVLLEAAYSDEAKERAQALTRSFEEFLERHRDEITALQVLYAQPYRRRLTYEDVQALARSIQAPPRAWTTEALWRAYETLDASRVRGTPARVLTNVVSLVRYAMHRDDVLVPFPEVARERFAAWMAQQESGGRRFTDEQRQWLEMIRDHIAANLEITPEDFEYAPFVQRGGLGGAYRAFGEELNPLLNELTEVLAA
ncbi:MAG TPA: type I restriction-modification enzyme R subunit C-terminal domain-containing protein [Longimicrobiaceae bacterium]|nr:type I restriction-modification enzyme R subunit C-terminal domain-containing protein [Longimicrobiaceae bacterium]